MALTNRALVAQLEHLFEAFIQLIDTAIDEKSPYTGGHCARVPALTMLLAEAVGQARDGPLAGFAMTDKDRYELKIAGLLHDCGKVTTPVHVVDKGRKLETLHDRIHLIEGDGCSVATGTYDLVVCNPPYVNQASMHRLPPEFRHEPSLALAGGEDGMDFIRPMLHQLPKHLAPDGALVLEIGHEWDHFVHAFPSLNGLWLPTSAGDGQVVLLTKHDLMDLPS